jgi:hypothetical protein
MITSLAGPKHVRIAGLTAGALAIAGAAIWVTAAAAGYHLGFQSPSTPPAQAGLTAATQTSTASSVCSDFVSHLGSNLGADQTKFNAAFQKAIAATLADEVKNKDLTQAQADAIKAKLAGRDPCSLISAASLRKSKGGQSGQNAAYMQALLSAAASSLGITDQELKTELGKGMTLSQIAAAQNPPVTEAEFRSGLIAKLTPLLDQAVKDQKLTSAQEQAILKQLQTGPIPLWNTPLKSTANPNA